MKTPNITPSGRLLKRSFYDASPEIVAPRLLGKLLVRSVGERKLLSGRIVEVEAYLGPHNPIADAAAHSHRGQTERNSVLFGPAGYAYVYFIYGLYYCANVSCEGPGLGGGILIRALEPVAGIKQMARNRGLAADAAPSLLTSGPSRLCQALGITRSAHNGLDLTDRASPLQVRDDGFHLDEVFVSKRIGIRNSADLPLRFSVREHPCVSGPKSPAGKRIFLAG